MNSSLVTTANGPTAWKYLNGLFCAYKPLEKSAKGVKLAILTNLCRTLNELQPRPVSKYVSIEGPADKPAVIVRPDYSDHPLVVGPRYQPEDIRLSWATPISRRASGVLVFGINKGVKKCLQFHEARLLRTYRLKGRLGEATNNMFVDGKVLERASYEHVKIQHLNKVLATFQASHQKQMFLQSGIDIESQAAYEMAVKGLLRPADRNVPLVYQFKTVEFDPPNFTIEIQCINEYEDYLLTIIHDIGARLRTLAVCTGLQCTRHGCFTTEHALLRKHWTAEHIINNITMCQNIMKEANVTLSHEPFLQSVSGENDSKEIKAY